VTDSIRPHNPSSVFPPYSLRFFLTSTDDDPANVASIIAYLGDDLAARTVVVDQLLEPEWRVEVEAVAAKI
jgi:2-iminobutanoate/2-iminopropanoate deaminase